MKHDVLYLILILPLFVTNITLSQEKLEVEGAISIMNAQDTTPSAGTIRWNGADFEGWNGSEWISFTSRNLDGATGTVQDIEGNTYKTVKIADQWWMAENLRATKYNDGSMIPKVTVDTSWSNLTTPGYCWYSNDSTTYANAYGAMYNYYAVADTNSKNVCPTNWHVPTDAEWTTLIGYLGGDSIAGGKMKEAGPINWILPNPLATNESGFTGLPGGDRNASGLFYDLGFVGYWWSSSKSGSNFAWSYSLIHHDDNVLRIAFVRPLGLSARCMKD